MHVKSLQESAYKKYWVYDNICPEHISDQIMIGMGCTQKMHKKNQQEIGFQQYMISI